MPCTIDGGEDVDQIARKPNHKAPLTVRTIDNFHEPRAPIGSGTRERMAKRRRAHIWVYTDQPSNSQEMVLSARSLGRNQSDNDRPSTLLNWITSDTE